MEETLYFVGCAFLVLCESAAPSCLLVSKVLVVAAFLLLLFGSTPFAGLEVSKRECGGQTRSCWESTGVPVNTEETSTEVLTGQVFQSGP